MCGLDEIFFCRKTLTMTKQILYLLLLPLLLCGNAANALKPKKAYAAIPDEGSFPGWKALRIETADHYNLAVWRLQPKGADRHVSIIAANGDAGNMSNWLPLAYALTWQGYTVLTFDYRGFGGSDDFPIDTTRLYYNEFDEDLKAMVRWSRMQLPANKVAVYAFSMGSIIAARVWAEAPADYFIAEGFVTNPVVTQQRLAAMKGKMFTLPADAAFHADKLKNLPGRMLVFSGTLDAVCKPEDYAALKAQHPEMIVKSFNGGHGGGFNALMESATNGPYMRAITDFISK